MGIGVVLVPAHNEISTVAISAIRWGRCCSCHWLTTGVGGGLSDQPVRVIVPFGAGGSTDITARLISQWLSERFGQQFVVTGLEPAPMSALS
jgi:hypothetical protein